MPRKCKLKIIPGPTGPTGPYGFPAPMTPGAMPVGLPGSSTGMRQCPGPLCPPCPPPSKRVLKVQLEAGLPAPNIIEGFRYESTVQPPDWPVAGTFNYFRAEVLDTPGYAMGESFSVAASIVYADTVASTQNQLVIAHYRNDKLLAYHCAVSEIVGTEDYLIAQSIQEAAVGDFFYVAITPDTTDLINFNHNLASLETIPADRSFNFPADIDSPLLIAGTADNPHVAGKYIATVTKDTSTIFTLCGGGGGGGAGGTSSTEDNANSVIIGRGGTGGCAGFPFVFNIALAKGDILTWTLGAGGAGGVSGGDGMPGMPSFLRLNGGVIGGTPSTPGGVGGFSGDNDSWWGWCTSSKWHSWPGRYITTREY